VRLDLEVLEERRRNNQAGCKRHEGEGLEIRIRRNRDSGITTAHHLRGAARSGNPTPRRLAVPVGRNRRAAPRQVHALVSHHIAGA
jgi:hypothetical protein